MERRRKDMVSIWIALCLVLTFTKSVESQDFVVNNVTIKFNRTCSSNVNVSCFVYYIKGQGCSAQATTAFPHLYRISEDIRFPEKPQSMTVKPFYRKYPHPYYKYYPGLKVTLKAPVTGSFDVLKGFELIYTYNLDATYACLIFDLSAGKLSFEDVETTDFWVDVWPLNREPDPPVFLFVSRSLPPALAEYDQYLNRTVPIAHWGDYGTCVSSSECSSKVTYSSQWVTTIFNRILKNSSGPFNEIEVSFALAPSEFHFTVYTVTLVDVNKTSPVHVVNVTKDYPSYVFKRILPGTYIIKVLPFDLYFNLGPGRCLCKNEMNGCFPCLTTITKNFSVGNSPHFPQNTESFTVSNIESITAANNAPFVKENESPGPNTIAAVVGALLGIVLVAIVGFFFFHWRRKDKDESNQHHENYEHVNVDNSERQDIGSINPIFPPYNGLEFDEGIGGELSKKTIFLAYAEDNNYHNDVVTSLAGFLKTHCRCNVIYAPWKLNEIMQDKFRWVINSIDQADYTVIVNSKRAQEQFKQWKSNGKKDSKIFQGSPLADLFIPILNQTCIRLNNNAEYRKFIMVRFDYTSKEHTITELNSGGEYILMKHLREFLCHVHKIDQHKTKMEDVGLAFVDDFTQLADGTELNKKIQRAKEFESSSTQRMDSHDSGMHSMSSVTNDDMEEIRNIYEQIRGIPIEAPSLTGYQGDSITDIIEHGNPTGLKVNPKEQIEFRPPSVVNQADESSEILMLEIEQFNKMNTDYNSQPNDLSFMAPGQEIYLNDSYDDESCRSIGGRSV